MLYYCYFLFFKFLTILFFSDAPEKNTSTEFLQNQHIHPGLFTSPQPADSQILTSTYQQQQQQQVNNPQPPTTVYNAHLFDNQSLTSPSLNSSFNYSTYNNQQHQPPFYDNHLGNQFQQPGVTIPQFTNNQPGYDYVTPSVTGSENILNNNAGSSSITSTVLSSFSNILSFGGQSKQDTVDTNIAPVTNVNEQWISPSNAPVNPVPLFPTNQQDTSFASPNLTAAPPVLATPPVQGNHNSYSFNYVISQLW